MMIRIMTKYNSSKQKIEPFGDGRYLVYFTCSKEEGEKAMVSFLSKYLGVPASLLCFKSNGQKGEKIFEIR